MGEVLFIRFLPRDKLVICGRWGWGYNCEQYFFFLCAHVPPKKVFAGIKTSRAFSIYSSNVFFSFLSAAYAIVFFAGCVFGAKQLPFTVCKVQNCLQRDTKPWKTIGSSNHTLYIFPSFRFSLFSFLSSSSGLVFDMISGSDEGDKVKDRQSYAGSQSTWQNARCRCAGVSGGASLRVKSVYKCEIKQRVKSVELLDIACRGIIGRVLECRPPPPLKWDSRRLQTACVHLKLNQGLILNRHFDKSHIIQDTSRHAKWENLITPLTPSKGITAFTYIWSANPKNSNIQLDANIYACIRFFFFWYWFYSKVIFESVLWCDVALRCIISYLFLKCAFFVCVQPNPAHMKTKLFSVGEEIPQRPGS